MPKPERGNKSKFSTEARAKVKVQKLKREETNLWLWCVWKSCVFSYILEVVSLMFICTGFILPLCQWWIIHPFHGPLSLNVRQTNPHTLLDEWSYVPLYVNINRNKDI